MMKTKVSEKIRDFKTEKEFRGLKSVLNDKPFTKLVMKGQ